MALIADGTAFLHLGYFSLKCGNGFFRGGHFHNKKIEDFYIISGKLRAQLIDLESNEKSEIFLQAGDCVTIYPKCAHRFIADEDAQVIEYYNTTYDPDDDMVYSDF